MKLLDFLSDFGLTSLFSLLLVMFKHKSIKQHLFLLLFSISIAVPWFELKLINLGSRVLSIESKPVV